MTWIGHSTLLVQLDGVNFLTDPTWAERTGSLRGVIARARYTPPPMRVEDLPPIDFVLISHDHYDHLDEPTVRYLARLFNPPLRRAARPQVLAGRSRNHQCRGVARLGRVRRVRTPCRIVCTPAQHGSGPHARRSGQTALVLVVVLEFEAVLLRRADQGLRCPLQGDRRPRWGRSTWRRCPSGRTRRRRSRPPRPHLARGGPAGDDRPARGALPRHPLGDVRPRAGAERRAAQAPRPPRSSGAASIPPRSGCCDPARPGPGRSTASSTGTGSSRAAASRSRDSSRRPACTRAPPGCASSRCSSPPSPARGRRC